jgi:hypothetical protein
MAREVPMLETYEDYKTEAKRLKTVAYYKHKAAEVRRGWDSFTKQQSKSKNDIVRELQMDLEFLDKLCRSDNHPSILKEEEEIAMPTLAWEE